MRRTLIPLLALAAVLVGVAPAAAKSGVAVTIRHQSKGCHSWSVNGGPYKASQTIHVKAGTLVTFTNDDVMSHRLIQLAGPRVAEHNLRAPAGAAGFGAHAKPGLMERVGAGTRVVLAEKGVYRFTTKGGEDYFKGVETVGEDNVLRLTIVVS